MSVLYAPSDLVGRVRVMLLPRQRPQPQQFPNQLDLALDVVPMSPRVLVKHNIYGLQGIVNAGLSLDLE